MSDVAVNPQANIEPTNFAATDIVSHLPENSRAIF
jgi:hypothetical protein